MYISLKKLTIINSIGLSGISLIAIAPANAFTVTFSGAENLGFESQYNGWTTVGDTTVQSTFQTISPRDGSTYQALITNACHDCVDNGSIRNDDSHINSTTSTFNYSNTTPITASVEQSNNLQSFLGISDNGLSIPAQLNGTVIEGVFRTPKEGSAILSDSFTVDSSFDLSFDWNYLTNDGAGTLGNQDFSFVTITGTTTIGNKPVEQVILLGDSSGTIPSTPSNNFAEVTGYETYSATALEAGTYRVGFGVVDVDNVDRSSALLVDNFSVEQVPFDFSPSAGLFLAAGIFGLKTLLKRNDSEIKE